MKTQLVTSQLDYKTHKKNNFYLGTFCISDNLNYDPNIFNKKNTLFLNDAQNIKNYKYLKKISKKILIFLAKKLNKIHNCKKNLRYWKMIIYPWVCYYVATINDRWKRISIIEKYKKKYLIKKIILDNNFLEVESTMDWLEKVQNDKFNNNLFNKIIEFKKIKNIKHFCEKDIFLKKKNKSFFISIYKKIFFFINYYFLKFNKVYFDYPLIKRRDFIEICLKLKIFQIKSNNIFHDLDFNINYNDEQRKKINIKKSSSFENFLFTELKNYIPKTFIEKYPLYLNTKIIKNLKKKIIFAFYSISFIDYFKIFAAESYLKKGTLIYAPHSAGCHLPGKYDVHFNYLNEITDNIVTTSLKSKLNKKEVFIPLEIFKKKLNKKKTNKLLICFHEMFKYTIRPTLYNVTTDINLKKFNNLIKYIPKLNPEIQSNIKFRNKENTSFNFSKKFAQFYGEKKIEYANKKSFRESITESKLVICFLSQTTFTEILYSNIPVILIDDIQLYLNSKMINKKFLESNILFNNFQKAFKFINSNWENLDEWWHTKRTQTAKNLYLEKFYYDEKNIKNNEWISFLKKKLNKM